MSTEPVKLIVLAVGAVVASCGPPEAMPPPVAPEASPSPARTATQPDEGWGEVASTRQNIAMRLPDARGWEFDDRGQVFLVGRHEKTSSVLRVRFWREGTRENRGSCEAIARARSEFPSREGADMVETFALAAPTDHATLVEVGVRSTRNQPGNRSPEIEGFVMAFGGYARSCFAFSYVTRARGEGAERQVGERLARIAHTTLPTMRFGTDLEPEIERTPSPHR